MGRHVRFTDPRRPNSALKRRAIVVRAAPDASALLVALEDMGTLPRRGPTQWLFHDSVCAISVPPEAGTGAGNGTGVVAGARAGADAGAATRVGCRSRTDGDDTDAAVRSGLGIPRPVGDANDAGTNDDAAEGTGSVRWGEVQVKTLYPHKSERRQQQRQGRKHRRKR